jgi:hypothetical protein
LQPMLYVHACHLNNPQSAFAPFIAGSSPESLTTHMSQRIAKQIIVALFALAALASNAAWADRFQRGPLPRSAPRNVPQRVEPQGFQSQRNENEFQRTDPRDGGLPASVRRVQRETGGQVLKAQPMQRDGREMYRVKVLTPQGRIRVVEDIPPLPHGYSPPNSPGEHRPE